MTTDYIPHPSPTPHLVAGRRGATGWLMLNRPERRNAMSAEMWRAIPRAIAEFDADAAIRCVVLRGEGTEAFAAGAEAAAGAAPAGFAPPPAIAVRTSFSTTRPCGPDPWTDATSMPASLAIRLASGEAKTRLPACACPAPLGFAAPCAWAGPLGAWSTRAYDM